LDPWIAEGRPRGLDHSSYTHYKKAKADFRNIQGTESKNYIDKVYSDLDNAAGLDYSLFWKLLRRNKQFLEKVVQN